MLRIGNASEPEDRSMHVHVGALNWVIAFAYTIISLFVLRLLAARYPDTAVGKAAAALN